MGEKRTFTSLQNEIRQISYSIHPNVNHFSYSVDSLLALRINGTISTLLGEIAMYWRNC